MNYLQKTYRSNTWKTGFIMSVNQDYILFGVYVIYMIFMGLSLSEISIVISSWLVLSSVGQIPGGVFADKYGYKTSIVIGLLITIIGTWIFAYATTFIYFMIGYSLNGFGAAMISGADQALVYESMKEDKREKDYKKVVGKLFFYGNISGIFLTILGGVLYSYVSPGTPFVIQIIINTFGFLLALSLKPISVKVKKTRVIKQIIDSMKYAFMKKKFSKIFIFSAVIGSISITTNQFLQPFYASLNIGEQYFGLIGSLSFLFWGLGSLYSDKLGKLFSIDHYLVLHASIFSLVLIILHKITNIPFTIILISVLFFLRGLYMPTVSNYINDKVLSDKRATMLSVNSQLLYVTSSLSLFGIGYLADNYSLSIAFFGISILSQVFLIIYILSLRKVEVE